MSEIFCIQDTDADYPRLLRHIPNAPKKLYCRGTRPLLNATNLCAIVGSRTPTSYGLSCTESVVHACVERHVVTVSGLAFGIDARAHHHTLRLNAPTIAVLGSSVDDDTIYPRSHVRLAHEIIAAGGLLISEHPVGTHAHKGSFPLRNRIIAGIAQATCVIEAREKSGSLITAYSALENNREVFAVPGSIFSQQSAGTLKLIERGATPWICADSFQYIFPAQEKNLQNIALPEELLAVLQACAEERSVDALSQSMHLPTSTLQEHLGRLLLLDYLSMTPYGNYIATRQIPRSSTETTNTYSATRASAGVHESCDGQNTIS